MFKFNEGAYVAIKSDNTELGLVAGETGTVWALYDTQPPAYEVTFCSREGDKFDALMYEDELAEPATEQAAASSSREPSLASA